MPSLVAAFKTCKDQIFGMCRADALRPPARAPGKLFEMDVILASASPRRRELLKKIVHSFKVIPAVGGENADMSLPPEDIARSLAEHKCDEVFASHPRAAVIGCDTIVVFEGEVLGKPRDGADAAATLKRLSGKTHCVITGVCVRRGNKKLVRSEKTEVTFNVLSEEFIKDYVAGGSPLDKAGSYGIQDKGVVSHYSGSYSNVVGMPIGLVEKMLEKILND